MNPWRLGWLLAWVWLMGLTGPAWASVYQVEGVEVAVPLPQPNNVIPQQYGLELAKQEAFSRLQNRMFTPWDRETMKDFLAGAAKELDKYLQGVVLRSEKRRASRLELVVDVSFSRDKVSQAVANLGFAYCETPMPKILLVVARPGPGGGRLAGAGDPVVMALAEATKRLGVKLALPLGDVEDTMNLTPERLATGDGAMLEWAAKRHAAEYIWWVSEGDAGALALTRITAPGVMDKVALGGPQGASLSEQATKIVQETQGRWIKEHLVVPDLRQAVRLRVEHPRQAGVFAKFHRALRQFAGVGKIRFLRMSAGETLLEMEYQGHTERLLTLLGEVAAAAKPGENGELHVRLSPSS